MHTLPCGCRLLIGGGRGLRVYFPFIVPKTLNQLTTQHAERSRDDDRTGGQSAMYTCESPETATPPGTLQREGSVFGAQRGPPPPHITLLRPAFSFSLGRCGCASQHKVFCNTTSFLDRPLFNTLFPATNTEFALVTSGTVRPYVPRPPPEHCTTQTSRNNPHVCRPHLNGTPSLLSERHYAARNTGAQILKKRC